jgi:hypothetical protein
MKYILLPIFVYENVVTVNSSRDKQTPGYSYISFFFISFYFEYKIKITHVVKFFIIYENHKQHHFFSKSKFEFT